MIGPDVVFDDSVEDFGVGDGSAQLPTFALSAMPQDTIKISVCEVIFHFFPSSPGSPGQFVMPRHRHKWRPPAIPPPLGSAPHAHQ